MNKKIRVLVSVLATSLLAGALSLSPSAASAAETAPVPHSAAFAEGYRIFMTCSGHDPKDGATPCFTKVREANNYNFSGSFTSFAYKNVAGDNIQVEAPNWDLSVAFNTSDPAVGDFATLAGYAAPVAKAGPNYTQFGPTTGNVMARPTFKCQPAECYSDVYISIVPLGRAYGSSGNYLGTAPDGSSESGPNAVYDPGIADYGAITNNTNTPAPGSPGAGGGSSICQVSGGPSDCATYNEVNAITDCININPLEFKFDIPCIFAYLFVPSDDNVSAVKGQWNFMLENRQPFVWFGQLSTTANAIFGTTGQCSPLGYEFVVPIVDRPLDITLFPCNGEFRDIIRPYSTWAVWLLIAGMVGTWAWRRVQPSLTAQGTD